MISWKPLPVKEKPKMIICGASAYSRDWDYKRIRAVADEIGAVDHGRYCTSCRTYCQGLLNDPFDHCHIITSTTHKTLTWTKGWYHHAASRF